MTMNRLLQVAMCVVGIIGFGPSASWGSDQNAPTSDNQKAKTDDTAWIDPTVIQDAKARESVGVLKTKLAPIKGYKATLIGSGFSPNGGLLSFPDEQWVRRPDHMLVKRKASSPYNNRLVMTLDVTIVVNGDLYLTKKTQVPLTPEQHKMYEEDYGKMIASTSRSGAKMSDVEKTAKIESSLKSQMRPSYTKIDIATVSQSVPDFNTRTAMSSLNNLLDPFAAVKMKTLKIVKETPEFWVFKAEIKQPIPEVKAVLMTFDRNTGFLSQVQWEIDMMGTTETRTTLQVNKVSPEADLPDSLFKMDMPPENWKNQDEPRVTDDTQSTIDEYRMSKEVEEESRKAVEAQKKDSAIPK